MVLIKTEETATTKKVWNPLTYFYQLIPLAFRESVEYSGIYFGSFLNSLGCFIYLVRFSKTVLSVPKGSIRECKHNMQCE